jgi:hypothetical protein
MPIAIRYDTKRSRDGASPATSTTDGVPQEHVDETFAHPLDSARGHDGRDAVSESARHARDPSRITERFPHIPLSPTNQERLT